MSALHRKLCRQEDLISFDSELLSKRKSFRIYRSYAFNCCKNCPRRSEFMTNVSDKGKLHICKVKAKTGLPATDGDSNKPTKGTFYPFTYLGFNRATARVARSGISTANISGPNSSSYYNCILFRTIIN